MLSLSDFRDATDNKELTGYTGWLAVPLLDEMPGSRGNSMVKREIIGQMAFPER